MSPTLHSASLHSTYPQLSLEECEYLSSLTRSLPEAHILAQQVLAPQTHAIKDHEIELIVQRTGIEREQAKDVLLVTRGNLEDAICIIEKIILLHKKTSPENIKRLQSKHPELSEIEARNLLEATATTSRSQKHNKSDGPIPGRPENAMNAWHRPMTYEEEAMDDAILQASHLLTGYSPDYVEIQRLKEKYTHIELQTIEQILESTQGDVKAAEELLGSLVDTYIPTTHEIDTLKNKFPQIDKTSIISILESAAGDMVAAEETASVVAAEIIPEQGQLASFVHLFQALIFLLIVGHYHIRPTDDVFVSPKKQKNAQRSAKKKVLAVEPQASLEKGTRFSSVQSSPWKNVNPTVVAKNAQVEAATTYRNQAQEILNIRSDLFEKAARAYRTGGRMGGAIAAYYADEARAQSKLMQSLNAKAAQSITNSTRYVQSFELSLTRTYTILLSTASQIDLHGLHANEIISIVSGKLNAWYQNGKTD